MSEGYQGYKNYETWCIQLWLSNDQESYNEIQSLARHATSTYELSRVLKELVQDRIPLEEQGASLYKDLLGAAISEVDWLEVAEHWYEEEEEE